jgi:hypothetical protein
VRQFFRSRAGGYRKNMQGSTRPTALAITGFPSRVAMAVSGAFSVVPRIGAHAKAAWAVRAAARARRRDRTLKTKSSVVGAPHRIENDGPPRPCAPKKPETGYSEQTFTGGETCREGRSQFCWLAGVRIADHPAGAHRDGRSSLHDRRAFRRRDCSMGDAASLSDVQATTTGSIPPDAVSGVCRTGLRGSYKEAVGPPELTSGPLTGVAGQWERRVEQRPDGLDV